MRKDQDTPKGSDYQIELSHGTAVLELLKLVEGRIWDVRFGGEEIGTDRLAAAARRVREGS